MDKDQKKGLLAQIMKDPSVLAHLQDHLHKSLENPTAYVEVSAQSYYSLLNI